MGSTANTRGRSAGGRSDRDGPALDGLVGAAVALIGVALVLAVLAHWTELTLGTTTRAEAIGAAITFGAVAGCVGARLRPRRVSAVRRLPRSSGC